MNETDKKNYTPQNVPKNYPVYIMIPTMAINFY